MKINHYLEEGEHFLEIYLSSKELKRIYDDDGAAIKKEIDMLGDGKNVNVYIGPMYHSE